MPPVTRGAFVAGAVTTLCYLLICGCPLPHNCDRDITFQVFSSIWLWVAISSLYFLYGNVAVAVYKTACRVSIGIANFILNGCLWYHWYAGERSIDKPWWAYVIPYVFVWAFLSCFVHYLIKPFIESRIRWFMQRNQWKSIVQEIGKLPQISSFDDSDQSSCFICNEEMTPLLKRACNCKNLYIHAHCWNEWLLSRKKHCTNMNELLMCDVCTQVWVKA